VPLPVISIPIDDAQFSRFREMFDKYTAALAKTPGLWKAASKEQIAAGVAFEKLAASMNAAGQKSVNAVAEQAPHLQRAEGLWTSIARSAGSVASSVFSIGAGLLKWSGILGGIGGLLGAGGLWGIDRMAGGVASDRRRAMGLGMNVGAMRAFGIDFGRLGDTDAMLGGVNEMETDISQQSPAFALLGHALTGNTEADSLAMLQGARNLALRTQTNQLGMTFRAYGLSGMYDSATQRRLQSMSGGEFAQMSAAYAKDTKALSIQDKVTKGWTDLVTQLERAGAQISKVFVTGLFPLEKPLEQLSKGFVAAVEAFMHTDAVKDAITSLASGLGSISSKLTAFANDISDIEDLLHAVAHPGEAAAHAWQNIKNELFPSAENLNKNPNAFQRYLSKLDTHFGLPAGALETWKQLEHSAANAISPKGAMGMFQFMPQTAAQYGLTDPFDQTLSANAAGKMMQDLLQHYRGDMAAAFAAVNYGAGNVDQLMRQYSGNWQKHLPRETQQYIMNASPLLSAYGMRVEVVNNTGGSAVATVSALHVPTADMLR
jgi:Transglycosylase SLT domain